MNGVTSSHHRPGHRAIKGLMRHAGIAFAALWALPGMAASIPAPVFVPPHLGDNQNGLSAVQVILSGSATTNAVGPNLEILSGFDSYSETSRAYLCAAGQALSCEANAISNAKAAHASINGYLADTTSDGSAEPGTLHSSSTSHVARPDTRGGPAANSSSIVTFTDVIFFGSNGDPELSDPRVSYVPKIGVTAKLSASDTVPAGAGYRFFLFMFPYLSGRTFEEALLFSQRTGEGVFISASDDARGASTSQELGSLANLNPFSAYWVHAVLQVSTGTDLQNNFFGTALDGKAVADLSHTVNLFIDPSPDNPLATYTTASGASYLSPLAPVPVPAGLGLFVSALVAGAVPTIRRAQYRRSELPPLGAA